MSDCGCEKTKAELEEFLHNELVRENATEVQEHIANCTDCSGEHRVGIVLTEAVRRACNESAPDDLRQQVLSTLRRERIAHAEGVAATSMATISGVRSDMANSSGTSAAATGV